MPYRPDDERRTRFIHNYLTDSSNAKQAAIKAGYAPKGAHVTASRLLRQPIVQEQIAAARERQAKKYNMTLDRIIEEMASIGFAPLDDEPVDITNKRIALLDLGKHLGGFVNRGTLGIGGGADGTGAIPIEVKHTVNIVRKAKDSAK